MTHTAQKTQRTGGEFCSPTGALLCFTMGLLSYLCHEIPHGLGGLVLLLPRGVGVGAESEPGVVVPQHSGHGLDVHAVLEGQGGEGVPEVVESEVLQPSVLQDALVEYGHRVQVAHGSIWEEAKRQGLSGCLARPFMRNSTASWGTGISRMEFSALGRVTMRRLFCPFMDCLPTEMALPAISRSFHSGATSSPCECC